MKDNSRRTFIKTAAVLGSMSLIASESEKVNTPTLKFIHATDTHMDLSNKSSVKSMELMVSHINKNYKDLDFVILGGDNFNNNTPGIKDALLYKEILSKLHCPFYLVRGNKESSPKPKDGLDAKGFAKLFFDSENMIISDRDWAVQKKGCQILGLDSSIDGQNNGLYKKETITFAKKMLSKGLPTIILNHHPYSNYWGGTEPDDIHKYVLGNSDEVKKEFFGYKNLLMTLSGHKHIDSVSKVGHVNVIATRAYKRPLDGLRYPMRYVEVTGADILEKLIYTVA